MKVLINVRPDFFTNPGGDTVQLTKTSKALESMGVKTGISNLLAPDLSGYDIVHISNLTKPFETHKQCINAKKHEKPMALSTIYWSMEEFRNKGLHDLQVRKFLRFRKKCVRFVLRNEKLRLAMTHIFDRYICRKQVADLDPVMKIPYSEIQKGIIESSDILLPNSEMEMDLIRKEFNLDRRYVVVPNGTDLKFKDASSDDFLKTHGNLGLKQDGFVLFAGRIEDRKNTLHLIKAVKSLNLTLVIIGEFNSMQPDYCKKCRDISGDKTVFLGHMDHDSLGSAYAAAKMHALPSWFETPGLSSIEAALAGCNIATTDRGSTSEYFKDYVSYCDPTNVKSIRRAVEEQFYKPKSDELKKHIIQNYNWKNAAKQTLKAYEALLKHVEGENS